MTLEMVEPSPTSEFSLILAVGKNNSFEKKITHLNICINKVLYSGLDAVLGQQGSQFIFVLIWLNLGKDLAD